MKKKLLSLIAVSAAVAITGSVLVACGNDGGNDGGNDVKTSVTAAQWQDAFSPESFTNNVCMTITSTMDGYTMEYTLTVGEERFGNYAITRSYTDSNGTKIAESNTIVIVGEEYDVVYGCAGQLENGVWVEYGWDDDRKTHIEYGIDVWKENILEKDIGFTVYSDFIGANFGSFTYKSGKYVYSGEGLVYKESEDDYEDYVVTTTYKITNAKIGFEDGKLVSMEIATLFVTHSTEDDSTTNETVNVSMTASYGEQTVTAPDFDTL